MTGGAAGEETPARSLADRLNRLFRTFLSPDGDEYTNEEVAEAIRSRGGAKAISASYIGLLRAGKRDNPSIGVLEELVNFFGVSPTYFFGGAAAERIDAEMELAEALRDTGIRNLALRAAALSPASLRVIADMVEHVRELEGIGESARRRRRPERSSEERP
jgi:transcriptional regulator with XRE-family HTH domain